MSSSPQDDNYDYDESEAEDSGDEEEMEELRRQLQANMNIKKDLESSNSPAVPKCLARNSSKNFTFGSSRQREIDRGNQLLVRSLSSITKRSDFKREHEKKSGSAGVNNRKRQNEIARENALIAKRLASVKGSKSTSRATLKKAATKQKEVARKNSLSGPGVFSF